MTAAGKRGRKANPQPGPTEPPRQAYGVSLSQVRVQPPQRAYTRKTDSSSTSTIVPKVRIYRTPPAPLIPGQNPAVLGTGAGLALANAIGWG